MASWHPHENRRSDDCPLGYVPIDKEGVVQEDGPSGDEYEAMLDPTSYAILQHELAYERAHPTHACDDDRWCPEFGCRACDQKEDKVHGEKIDLNATLNAGDVLAQLMRYEQYEATPEDVLRGIWDLVEAAAVIDLTKEAN